MNIDELEDSLPNGFHDCWLRSFDFCFSKAQATLVLDVDYDDVYQTRSLTFSDVSMCFVEPSLDVVPKEPLSCSGTTTTERDLTALCEYQLRVPAGTFFYSFFIRSRNCFIHVAAQSAELEAYVEANS